MTAEPSSPTRKKAPLSTQLLVAAGVFIPFAGLIAAVISVWGWGFTWLDFWLLVGFYLATALGITVGFHRLFTHRSFETYRPLKALLAVLGSMAVQGPLLTWVAVHRRHHRYSDQPEDPHTPHHSGRGFWGRIRGFIHAHFGWLFHPSEADTLVYAKDIYANRMLRWISYLFPLWVTLGLVVPGAIGGLVAGTWVGFWRAFLWGGLVRVFLVHHVTWSVNSVCHLWGSQPHTWSDQSRNNLLFGFLALGEGWHNTHHAFPTSARHGLRWWEVDLSYYFIRTLSWLGLAWDIKLPSQRTLEKVAAKRREIKAQRKEARRRARAQRRQKDKSNHEVLH